jgi:ribosomal protein L32
MAMMKEDSKAYIKEAINLALSSVTIMRCQDCGHPNLEQYICSHCGCDEPTTQFQEASYIEV